MAWTAWRYYSRIHSAAVLWWTEPALSTDGTALYPSGLPEAAPRHIGAASVHTCCWHAGDRHAQPLVCGHRDWHFVVYVCSVSDVDTDSAC